MQNPVAAKLQTFMEDQCMAESIFTIEVSYDSTIGIESVLLSKVHVESQIVCSKMHQRGSVKKGNMGVGKSFIESMHEGNMGH